MKSKHHAGIARVFKRKALVLAVAAAVMPLSSAFAQDSAESEVVLEEVLVTGTLRDTIRNSIELKRESSTIVDAISASDIGVLPDLSVAETLERVTGVTGDRFKGNASEISIRGLGPFLVSSTFNGREVSSGSGNRAVAFSQFPSELVSRAVIYKAQQADLLEGGVAGSVDLGVLRPIDYGKRRIQGEVRGNLNDYQAKIKGDDGLGYRASLSYTDVFDTGNMGTLGVAIGAAVVDSSTPEESYLASSTLRPCNSDNAVSTDVSGRNNSCTFDDTNARAANGVADANGEFYFIPNQFQFRQMNTEETRDSIMATIQWQPNDDWDISADYLFSNRFYFEDRHDLVFDDGRRNIRDWVSDSEGNLQSYTGQSFISTYGEYRERDEDYTSYGLNAVWQANDRLELKADISYSDTVREQVTFQTRLRPNGRQWFDWEQSGEDFGRITAIYSDINNKEGTLLPDAELLKRSFYNGALRARITNEAIEDTITAFDFSGEYELNAGIITTVKSGFRFSTHDTNVYVQPETVETGSTAPSGIDNAGILAACNIPFLQNGFGEDANTTITQWAVYDTRCAFNEIVGDAGLTSDAREAALEDIFITEDVASMFAMANYELELGNVPVSGNFGVRVVSNNTTSRGFRSDVRLDVSAPGVDGAVTVTPSITGDLTLVEFENDYVNVLPSFNINFGLTDEVELRGAIYRAISRPDMWWLGAGRELDIDENDTFSSAEEALQNSSYSAFGNPNMEAIESDNYDLSLGYYPNEDTALSLALYHKKFNAGFGAAQGVSEEVVIDGVSTILPVSGLIEIQDSTSTINGVEVSVQHTFSYLPEPFNGLGLSTGFNYADTDFETPEGRRDITDQLETIQTIYPSVNDITGFITPASLPGFSKTSYTFETYWENYGWQARIAYKFRDEYLKPFGNTLNQTNRYVADTQTVDASLSYRITDAFTLSLQVLNATNEPYIENRVTDATATRVEYSGRKYFAGVKFRF